MEANRLVLPDSVLGSASTGAARSLGENRGDGTGGVIGSDRIGGGVYIVRAGAAEPPM